MALVDKIAKFNGWGIGQNAASGDGLTIIPGTVPGPFGKIQPLQEIGVSGLLRTKGTGYIYEEWLRDLSTFRAKQVYREMRDNDAVIGSMFFALEMILRKAEWRVEPAAGAEGQKNAEFVESCMKDMSHTWEDLIAESVNMFAFGFSLFETVYKKRKGDKGKSASKFDDGLIGWRKFAPRAQESILYWMWDEEGGLQGAVQLAAPDYHSVPIPIEKLILFRTTSLKNSPEGRSILRNCYRSYFFKRRIEEVEGIGIERDLCGIPVLYASLEAVTAMGGEANARKLVTNIRMDDQSGVVLPLVFDDNGNQLVKLELLKAAGRKQTNPSDSIKRYNSDILNTIMAGFIQMGQTPTGSRSLHLSATAIFSQAIAAFMDSIAAVINRIAIPRLMALNGMDLKTAPTLAAGEIGVRDLDALADYIQKLSSAGMTFFDKDTVDYARKAAGLPEAPEDDESGPPIAPGAERLPGGIPGATTQNKIVPPGAPKGKPSGKDVAEDDAEGKERLQGVA